MYGYRDPFNRQCFPWDNIDAELYNFFAQIGKARKKLNLLSEAKIRIIEANDNLFVFERFIEENEGIIEKKKQHKINRVVIAVNRTKNDVNISNFMDCENEKNIFEYNYCDNILSQYGIVIKAVK